MKVLLVTAAFPPMKAGEAEHMHHLHMQLRARGVQSFVLTSRGCDQMGYGADEVSPIIQHWSWLDLISLGQELRRRRPDAILLYYIGWIYHHHPMVTYLPTLAKRLLPQCRFVTMFAYPEGSGGEKVGFAARVGRKLASKWAGEEGGDYEFGTLLRDSDRVAVMSDLHRPRFGAHYSAIDQKAVLIPPPPLLTIAKGDRTLIRQEVRTRLGLTPENFVFAYFGFIYPAKGLETILAAFASVHRTHPHARLLIVGGELTRPGDPRPRYGQEMRQLGDELGCGNAVHWTGGFATDSDEASRYLMAADAGIFGHDLGIAMNNSSFAALVSHRLPTVATRGDAPEMPLRHGENVWLCQAKDPEAMAEGMRTLLEQAGLRHHLVEGAAQLANEWYSWEGATNRLLTVLAPTGASLRVA